VNFDIGRALCCAKTQHCAHDASSAAFVRRMADSLAACCYLRHRVYLCGARLSRYWFGLRCAAARSCSRLGATRKAKRTATSQTIALVADILSLVLSTRHARPAMHGQLALLWAACFKLGNGRRRDSRLFMAGVGGMFLGLAHASRHSGLALAAAA